METDSPNAAIRATVDEIALDQEKRQLASLVTDDGEMLVVPLEVLPAGTRVGDVMLVSFQRDDDERARRRQRIADLQRRLFGG